jgi:60s Acidic ribosomal protein
VKKALEGKDVKDLLLNVGSGGGAAPTAAGGAATSGGAGGAAEEAPKEEEKEEGMYISSLANISAANTHLRERGIRRRYGLRTVRLAAPCCLLPWSFVNSGFCPDSQYARKSRLHIATTICAGPTEIDISRWLQMSGVRARMCSRRKCKSH